MLQPWQQRTIVERQVAQFCCPHYFTFSLRRNVTVFFSLFDTKCTKGLTSRTFALIQKCWNTKKKTPSESSASKEKQTIVRLLFHPFTPKSAKDQNLRKIPNFVCKHLTPSVTGLKRFYQDTREVLEKSAIGFQVTIHFHNPTQSASKDTYL